MSPDALSAGTAAVCLAIEAALPTADRATLKRACVEAITHLILHNNDYATTRRAAIQAGIAAAGCP